MMFIKYFTTAIFPFNFIVRNYHSSSNYGLSQCLVTENVIKQQKLRPIRRSLLYVPGHDVKKIDKLLKLTDADCAILDCEDGVAYDKKIEARSTILKNYERISSQFNGDIGVRVNAPGSFHSEEDIKSFFESDVVPKTLIVPKINNHEEIKWACELVQSILYKKNQRQKPVNVIFMIESALGVINMKEIVECGISTCSRSNSFCKIDGVIFGSDDFCADIGIVRSEDAKELVYARQKIVTAAKAFGLQAIDMVYINYKDSEGLLAQSVEGYKMGFTGKQVIHPDQIEIVQQSFLPNLERIEWAQELIAAYEANKKGVFIFRDQMIDMPTIIQAQNIANMIKFIKDKQR